MNSSQVYPSRYLKSEELAEDITVTIKKVVLEELDSQDKGKQEKPVAYFNEVEKGLILNKTNWSLIAKQHGDESDDWTGKQITLTVMDVEAFGDIVSAIRVKPQRRTAAVGKVLASITKAKQVVTPAAPVEDDSDAVTAFWTAAKANGYDRKSGVELLESFNGNFAKALAGLQSGDVPF
jgi:hypothetical protein